MRRNAILCAALTVALSSWLACTATESINALPRIELRVGEQTAVAHLAPDSPLRLRIGDEILALSAVRVTGAADTLRVRLLRPDPASPPTDTIRADQLVQAEEVVLSMREPVFFGSRPDLQLTLTGFTDVPMAASGGCCVTCGNTTVCDCAVSMSCGSCCVGGCCGSTDVGVSVPVFQTAALQHEKRREFVVLAAGSDTCQPPLLKLVAEACPVTQLSPT